MDKEFKQIYKESEKTMKVQLKEAGFTWAIEAIEDSINNKGNSMYGFIYTAIDEVQYRIEYVMMPMSEHNLVRIRDFKENCEYCFASKEKAFNNNWMKQIKKRCIIIESALKASIISSLLLAMVVVYYFSIRHELEPVFQFVNLLLYAALLFSTCANMILVYLAQEKKYNRDKTLL